ncbi:DUF302 domain-containing protein [Congregibacter sp.]|uniref:DUF302 domain-containing protein n=1 Tax=Congregibacter sp. TaxID=2744308 RepID=UPI003F6B0C51
MSRVVNPRRQLLAAGLSLYVVFLVASCGSKEFVDAQRYVPIDNAITLMKKSLADLDRLEEVADIDHSRLAHDAASPMPPARVLMFSDVELETELISLNPLSALDLPIRILAFEEESEKRAEYGATIYNSFEYLQSRYQLDPVETDTLRNRYEDNVARVRAGLSPESFRGFADDEMPADGIITIDSPFDFEETVERINRAIDSQGDTVRFGVVDFQANASELGLSILPSRLILFGGPGPGGKAMASAPTLGLDAFCQKFLIWQDEEGVTHLSFNDLLALAERQGVSKATALRVINFRLKKIFGDALAAE